MNELLYRKGSALLPAHDSSKDLADKFCTFFTEKITSIRSQLDSINLTDQHTILSPITSSLGEGLSKFTLMTDEKILKIIKNSPTKSCSLDPLPTWFLKKTDTLLPTITQIINKSLASGTFPTSFKSALVRPLLKKTNLDTEVLRNYRPVSNLQYTSKVLEKVVAAQLTSYMRKHDLYEKKQSAYRCYHSTETALLKVQNNLLVAMDKSCGVFLVLFDLSAAFDTIDHDILIKRLHDNLGLSGAALAWMNSYLRGRSQSVVINGTKSEPADLQYGVPQGSVLGPILFTIYTSPIGAIAKRHNLEIHIYADDTQLYIFFKTRDFKSQAEALRAIKECVSEIRQWMAENKLQLNDQKTEFLIICAPWKRDCVQFNEIEIGDARISSTTEARNLGLIMDKSLNMEKHIQRLCQTSIAQLRNITDVRKYLTQNAAEKLILYYIATRLL